MKEVFKNRLLLSICFICFAVSIEIFMFVYLDIGVLPKYFLFDLSFLFLLGIIFALLPWRKTTLIISSVVVLLQIIISYTNICVYLSLDTAFSWNMLNLLGETKEAISMAVFPISPIVYFALILTLYIYVNILIVKNAKDVVSNKSVLRYLLSFVLICVVTMSSGFYTIQMLTLDKGGVNTYLTSDDYMYKTFSSSKLSLTYFGTFGYYVTGLIREIVPYKSDYKGDSVNTYSPADSVLWELCEDDNLIMICAESFESYAISKELTPTLYALQNGFDLSDCGANNFYNFSVDADGYTVLRRKDYNRLPNMYSYNGVDIYAGLDQNIYGLEFNNYYANNKTDFSEFSSILGSYPYLDTLNDSDKYLKNDFCNSIPNMLKLSNKIEVANYLHPYFKTFYKRNKYMPLFGFDNCLFREDMPSDLLYSTSLSLTSSDSKALDYFLNINPKVDLLPKNKKFEFNMMTVTPHGDYFYHPEINENYLFLDSLERNKKTEKYGNTWFDTGNANDNWNTRNYMALTLDTEYTVTILVDYLYRNNLLQNTTIAFYADHTAYIGELEIYKQQWAQIDDANDPENYRIPAFIYSQSIKNSFLKAQGYKQGREINVATWMMDFAPTLLTLFGVDFLGSSYLGMPVLGRTFEGKEIDSHIYVNLQKCIITEEMLSLDAKTLQFCYNPEKEQELLAKLQKLYVQIVEKWVFINDLYETNSFSKYLANYSESTS